MNFERGQIVSSSKDEMRFLYLILDDNNLGVMIAKNCQRFEPVGTVIGCNFDRASKQGWKVEAI